MAPDDFLPIMKLRHPQDLQTPKVLLQASGAPSVLRPVASVVPGQAEEVQVVTQEATGEGVASRPIISDRHGMRKPTDTQRDGSLWAELETPLLLRRKARP